MCSEQIYNGYQDTTFTSKSSVLENSLFTSKLKMVKVMADCESRERWPGLVVFLYLLGMTLMFAHLGNPITRPPPSFLLPRLLVMVAVAVLVWRRGGLPSSMRQSTSVIFEVSQTHYYKLKLFIGLDKCIA